MIPQARVLLPGDREVFIVEAALVRRVEDADDALRVAQRRGRLDCESWEEAWGFPPRFAWSRGVRDSSSISSSG